MERVESELLRRNTSLADFARRLGVRGQDINNWKRRGIPRDKQVKVADELGWTLDRLLTGRNPPTPLAVDAVAPRLGAGGAEPSLDALIALASPNSAAALRRIAQAAADRRLTDADVALVAQISERLAGAPTTTRYDRIRKAVDDDRTVEPERLPRLSGEGGEPGHRT